MAVFYPSDQTAVAIAIYHKWKWVLFPNGGTRGKAVGSFKSKDSTNGVSKFDCNVPVIVRHQIFCLQRWHFGLRVAQEQPSIRHPKWKGSVLSGAQTWTEKSTAICQSSLEIYISCAHVDNLADGGTSGKVRGSLKPLDYLVTKLWRKTKIRANVWSKWSVSPEPTVLFSLYIFILFANCSFYIL